MKISFFVTTQILSFWIVINNLSDAKKNMSLKIPLCRGKRPSKHVVKRDATYVDLKSVDDDYFYGPIRVGTPGQDCNVIFDTGSPDVWVMSYRICQEEPEICEESCGHKTYNHRNSSTYRNAGESWSITYQDQSSFSGRWCIDDMQLGDFVIREQKFAIAMYGQQQQRCNKFDGIMGLGYHSRDKPTCAFRNLMNQYKLTHSMFSFYLDNVKDTSCIIFGDYDPAYYTGDITWRKCVAEDNWIIMCDDVYIEDQLVMSDVKVLVDSGTSLLLCPKPYMNKLESMVGNLNELNCSDKPNLPSLWFRIRNRWLHMTVEDYMISEPETEEYAAECICGIDSSDQDMFIWGNVLMRKYYCIFDMKGGRIGFALANKDVQTEE